MRPVSLTIEGFGSFRDRAHVDFADVDYFALVGPTGSGKSTVIDALTFALYGSVPRWNDLKSVGLALAPTVTRALVQLVFDLGPHRYVAARDVRRSGRGVVTTKEARLDRLADPTAAGGPDDAVTSIADGPGGVTKAVERLVGLSFENFTKCVVLPQGKFAEFMSATPRQRREILVRLLGLDFYARMMQLANRRADACDAAVALATDQLGAYEDATDGALAEARARVAALDRLGVQVSGWLRALEADAHELIELEGRLRSADADLALLAAVSMPDGIDQLVAEHAEARRVSAESAAEHATAQQRCNEARQLVVDTPAAATLRGVLADRNRLIELKQRQSATSAALGRAIDEVGAASDEGAATSSAVVAAESRSRELEGLLAEANARRSEHERAIDALRAVVAPDALLAEFATAQHTAARAEAALERALADLRQAENQHAAAHLRSDLHPGDDCPVCLRPIAELPAGGDGAAELADARTASERAQVDAAAAQLEWVAAQDRLRSRLFTSREAVAVLGPPAVADDLVAAFRDLGEWAHDRTQAAAADLPALQARASELAAESASAQGQLDAARDAAAAAARRLQQATSDRARLEADARHERDEVGRLESATAGYPGDDEVQQQLAHVEALVAAEREAYRQMESAQARAERDLAALAELGTRVHRARQHFDDARGRLGALDPPEVEGDDLQACWQALARWADSLAGQRRGEREELAGSVEAARGTIAAGRDRISQALSELGLQPSDDPVRSAAATIAAALATTTAAVDRITDALHAKAELERRRDESLTKQRVALLLGRELRSDHFQDWVIASAFDLLVADASATLMTLSGNQFSLVLDGSEFSVVDHTDADAVRPVKTLSGGETFQASLALALALSEHITGMSAEGGVRLESIILDEGFGSLDDASLDQVAATLESLVAEQDRTVGIVTHVRSLADRVPVRFAVSRDQHSSTVTRETD